MMTRHSNSPTTSKVTARGFYYGFYYYGFRYAG
jgi:hypothetical protein